MSGPNLTLDSKQLVCVELYPWENSTANISLEVADSKDSRPFPISQFIDASSADGAEGAGGDFRPSYAQRIFSNDGAGGAAGVSTLAKGSSSDGSFASTLAAILGGLFSIFNLAGCSGGGEETVNPAPTTPCTPADQLDGGVPQDAGADAEVWVCPEDPPYQDPNPGAGCDENACPSPGNPE